MNLPAIALGGAALWLLFMPASRRIERGKTYSAIFRPPPGAALVTETLEKLRAIMPPGAALTVAAGNLVVTFAAPTTDEIGDLPTPIGVFKLVSLQQVA